MSSKFEFSPGSTLYLPCDLINKEPHLWVILTSPFNDPPIIIMVMLTTKKSYSDTTVELNIGDHQFISHPTVVSYMDANFFKVEELKKDINLGMAKPNKPFTKPVLEKIKSGLLRSKYTPKGIKNQCLYLFSLSSKMENGKR